MKLSKLGALIKDQKGAVVLDTVDADGQIIRQHIMLYGAMYPLDGYPQLDKDILMTILDVPKEKRADYWYREEVHTEKTMRWADDNPLTDKDTPASLCSVRIETYQGTLIPVITHNGLVFINAEYKKPISDETEVEYWCRQMSTGYVIVAKKGYQTIATIAPAQNWANDNVADDLLAIANEARRLSEEQKKRDAMVQQQRI